MYPSIQYIYPYKYPYDWIRSYLYHIISISKFLHISRGDEGAWGTEHVGTFRCFHAFSIIARSTFCTFISSHNEKVLFFLGFTGLGDSKLAPRMFSLPSSYLLRLCSVCFLYLYIHDVACGALSHWYLRILPGRWKEHTSQRVQSS